MRLRGNLSLLLRRASLGAAFGAALAGCADLDATNPNQPSQATFWKTPQDALAGTNAVYAGLLPLGTYGRWQAFTFDIRSDIGTARISPWGDLANYNRFVLSNYDFDINRDMWNDHFRGISRANQAIGYIPNIEMDPALRDRYVGEAKFIRALLYYNAVNLWGGNIPLILEPVTDPGTRPGSSTKEAVYAQIEQDLTDAAAALPATYGSADVGRATKGAALALLGKVQLQQHKWPEAAATLQQVIGLGIYSLMPNYGDNFTELAENNAESIFEVQTGGESTLASNVPGLSFTRMIGPCHPDIDITYCDGPPTRWYFEQFQQEQTTDGQPDPRLDATLFYNKPGSTEVVYGHPLVDLFADVPTTDIREDTLIFFKKYEEYYVPSNPQRWDNPTNYRVIRYADVLLMAAEALNETQGPGPALQYINEVRQRVKLPALAGLDQATLRDRIYHERVLELGLEGQRWFDIVRRYDLANQPMPADVLAELKTHDDDFNTYQPGKSELLPIPTAETTRNANITQNPGW
jgi:hypothetical protein